MNLEALAQSVPGARAVRGGALEIRRVTHDSRAVRPGDLFVALPGQKVDGRAFIPLAVASGAVAVAGVPGCEGDVPAATGFLAVERPRAALGLLAAASLGWPARALQLVGITGTNGKTTTSTILASMCEAAGWPPGLVGTVEHRVGSRRVPTKHTTPEAPDLQALFAEMRDAGVRLAAMEVSSIGLTEHRVTGVEFQVAAFLNLTPDHLDYHGDLEAYGAAKRLLFSEHLAPGGVAVICVDDPFAARVIEAVPAGRTVWRVSVAGGTPAEVFYERLAQTPAGLRGRLQTPAGPVEVETPLVGAFNATNVALAAACARAAGVPASAVEAGLRRATVRGRLERVPAPEGSPTVLIDYAHTPDALSRAIEAVRPFTPGRLIVVFGCGGDRDRAKRPLMGRAAAAADVVLVTTDNPRGEDPAEIAAAAAAGAGPDARIVLDRRAAIAAALALAGPQDTVLVAGKGHETYQEVQGKRHPFDDAAVAAELLAERRA